MSKIYDLERYAKNCRDFVRRLLKDIPNQEDSKQLVRSSGSVAANYIEANEGLSKKDFVHRLKISRKEAKETRLWLNLIVTEDPDLAKLQTALIQESTELIKIFTSIISKSE